MKKDFENNIEEKLTQYIYSLQRENNSYIFNPAKKITKAGNSLSLGFSCYALKLFYILNLLSEQTNLKTENWVKYINSFQKNSARFPDNSYIDINYLKYFEKYDFSKSIKSAVKYTLNVTGFKQYESNASYLEKSIRAETKQAIATVSQLGKSSKFQYSDFPKSENDIYNFLTMYDWSKPWDAGAQFSGLCVFASTQMDDSSKPKKHIEKFISEMVSPEYGLYFKNELPSTNEAINGAMKVISGLDWLDIPIHYPEKLIDFCLINSPNSTGCDLVDYVYVLYKCSKQTEYKKKETINYLENLIEVIEKHFNDDGGFSYFIDKSQTHYYGVEVSKGNKVSDIHGTLLITWANLLILDIITDGDHNYKIIKP